MEKKAIGGVVGRVSSVTHYSGLLEQETGESFSNRLKAQALSAGVTIHMEEVIQVDLDGLIKKVSTDQATYEAKAVIIAGGTTKRKLMLHSRLVALEGKDCVNKLKIQDEHTKEITTISSDGCGVFIYAGALPDSKLYHSLAQEDGYLVTNQKMETSIAGVYAAGDICVKQVRQAATAVSDGAIAGINAAAYIQSLIK